MTSMTGPRIETQLARRPPQGKTTILVVEDHEPLWDVIETACRAEQWSFRFVASGREAMDAQTENPHLFDVAIIDNGLPDMNGLDILRSLHLVDPTLPVLMLTGCSDPARIVECVKAGAQDYILKPFGNDDLVRRVRQTLKRNKHVPSRLEGPLSSMMGTSEAIVRLAQSVAQVGPTEMAVLIEGESGTGKELVARQIHACSRRSMGPFVPVDSGAIAESLVEGEMFGFRKGSFTGALRDRKGSIQAAHHGTLFLDEVANLSLQTQAKLLRVLQQKEVLPIGASEPVPVDVRLVSATNVPLQKEVENGRFRLDLFHRLAEFPTCIPPLRERPDDLVFLALRFLREAAVEFQRNDSHFSEEAWDELLGSSWPGNVRELRSVVRRAVLTCEGRIERLGIGATGPREPGSVRMHAVAGGMLVRAEAMVSEVALLSGHVPFKEIRGRLVHDIEQGILSSVLSHANGNRSMTARILGLDYKTVHTKAKGIHIKEGRDSGEQAQDTWQG